MVLVPFGEAGGVSGDKDVVVDDVERKAAIDVERRAFVFALTVSK